MCLRSGIREAVMVFFDDHQLRLPSRKQEIVSALGVHDDNRCKLVNEDGEWVGQAFQKVQSEHPSNLVSGAQRKRQKKERDKAFITPAYFRAIASPRDCT
jgi:hypothetical protein